MSLDHITFRKRLQRRALRLMVVNLVVGSALLWAARENDVLSCERQRTPRVTLQQFISTDAEFQRAMAAFDSPIDKVPHTVTLHGKRQRLTRQGLRRWVAAEWDSQDARLTPPDCGGIFPRGK